MNTSIGLRFRRNVCRSDLVLARSVRILHFRKYGADSNPNMDALLISVNVSLLLCFCFNFDNKAPTVFIFALTKGSFLVMSSRILPKPLVYIHVGSSCSFSSFPNSLCYNFPCRGCLSGEGSDFIIWINEVVLTAPLLFIIPCYNLRYSLISRFPQSFWWVPSHAWQRATLDRAQRVL